jgi:hypothetical protein
VAVTLGIAFDPMRDLAATREAASRTNRWLKG